MLEYDLIGNNKLYYSHGCWLMILLNFIYKHWSFHPHLASARKHCLTCQKRIKNLLKYFQLKYILSIYMHFSIHMQILNYGVVEKKRIW